jgi:GNAT superfamily N-acetyltransferase
MPSYEIVTGYENMDAKAIHAFLSTTYWSPGVPFEIVDRAMKNSLCFGLRLQGQQVAFARAVTDKATFAYLADVYVLVEHRGKGLSKLLLDSVFLHPDLQGLRRFLLATRDAHQLYAKYAFTPLANPARMMEVHNPNAYITPASNNA